ncbi:MAG: hypothetical protein ACJATI_000610 [Halioglobus sp.]|jgi:hypothetical protein
MKRFLLLFFSLIITSTAFSQVVTCGSPTNGTHCYDDNDATTWLYTASDGTSALKMTFNAGGVESCCDDINVYDGTDNTAPLLFSGNNGGDLAGLEISASGPNIFMEIDSDGSVSCVGGSGFTAWDWDVICLSCNPAAGTAAIGACTTGIMIDVNVTSVGDGTVVITNDGGVASTTVTATGTVAVGPFAFSSTVTITLEHLTDPTCNVVLPALSLPSACPPANDDCAGALPVTVNGDLACTSFTPGSIENSTGSPEDPTACGGTEDDDVWFSFVATGTSHTIDLLNVANGTTDLYHSVWQGSCGALTLLAGSCADPNNSSPSGMTIGNTYYLRVYSWTSTGGQTSTFDVCVGTPPAPPANDDCGGAFPVTVNPDLACGSTTPGTITFSTASPEDTGACAGTEDDDVWFTFVATATTHELSFINITGGTTDLYHSVWEGTCGGLTLLAGSCSDPNSSSPAGMTIGNTYYIRVYSWTSTSGQTSAFDVCVGTNPPPPPEDNCMGAIVIPVTPDMCTGITTGDNSGATDSNSDVPPPPAASCSSYAGGDIWFTLTVPASGNVIISGANSDGCCSYLWYEVYSGTDCSTLVSIACSDTNSGSDNNDPSTYETSLTGLTPASSIWIRAWDSSNDNGPGEFNFCAYELSCTAPTVTIPADPIDNTNCPTTVDLSISIDALGDSGTLTISAVDDMGNPAGTGGTTSATGMFTVTNIPVPQTAWSIIIAHESNVTCDVTLGPFILNCPPLNDYMCEAEAITIDAPQIPGNNAYSTFEANEVSGSCWISTTVPNSVWYSFVAPGSGLVEITTDFVTPLNDTQIALYTTTDCSDLLDAVEWDCDEDGGDTGDGWNSYMETSGAPLTGGDTYYVQVDGYAGGIGMFEIQVNELPPANDDCGTAAVLANGTTGSLINQYFAASTPSALAAEACDVGSTSTPADVWYSINTDADGGNLIVIVEPGPNSDVVVAIYNACGDAVPEQCVDLGGNGGIETINFAANFKDDKGNVSTTRDANYFVRIYEKVASGEPFEIGAQGEALPIVLGSFEAKPEKRGNRVEWTTLSEINSDYVEVQSSPNGSMKWEPIGNVQTKGESLSKLNYELFDNNPYEVTYYRLNAVDKDGKAELSHTINVKREDKLGRMSLSPNPTSSSIALQMVSTTDETGIVTVYEMTGKIVMSESINLRNGLNTYSIDLNELNTGIYLFSLQTLEGVQVEKIVKQ